MFTTPKLPHHVRSVKFSGTESDPLLDVAFYMTPVEYDTVYELSDRVANQLYRREGTRHLPVQEFGKTILNLGDLHVMNLELYPHNEDGADGAGRLIANCKIGEVCVDKLFSDKPDWSLIWKCTMPLDSNSIDLMRTYFRKTVFLTLVEAQGEIPFEADGKKGPIVLDDATVESAQLVYCELCKAQATYLGADMTAWCDEHVRGAVGIQVRKVKYVGQAAGQ